MVYFKSNAETGYRTYILSDSNYVELQSIFGNRNCSNMLLNSASTFIRDKIALVRILKFKN